MTDPNPKPKPVEPTSGLTPFQIGLALGVAAVAWMIADWLRVFGP